MQIHYKLKTIFAIFQKKLRTWNVLSEITRASLTGVLGLAYLAKCKLGELRQVKILENCKMRMQETTFGNSKS